MQVQKGATTTITTTTTATMAPYPSLPASPTLTNPDMILPYGEYDDTPSPPQDPYGDAAADAAITPFSIGSAQSHIGPSTPIIYGNGTMLSDIGEVTEAESTAGRSRRLPGPAERRMLKQRQNSPLRTTPVLGHMAATKRARAAPHRRHVSTESTSTVKSESPAADHFKDFDDGVSVDDSNFQGDDEESVADSYTEEIIASETRRLAQTDDFLAGDEDRTSSAALSRRAEQILLNAKKRLNNMEGNLTRARSSLSVSHQASNSSIHSSSPLSRSTGSPFDSPSDFPAQARSPAKHRNLNNMDYTGSSPGHSRVYSENSILTDVPTSPIIVRSASAAARYGGRSKYSPENVREERGLSRNSPAPHITLEPLGEEDSAPRVGGRQGSDRSSPEAETTSPGFNSNESVRSSSSMQMRDLRDQMHDLKGRLSVLRDRARDDTMKRRSLQSLRTPSPFTAAEQWYAGAKEYREGNLSADAVVAIPPWQEQTPGSGEHHGVASHVIDGQEDPRQPEYAESELTSEYQDVGEEPIVAYAIAQKFHVADVKDRHGQQGEDENTYDTAAEEDEGYADDADYNDEIVDREEAVDYESDASVYHDTYAAPISHEDREDAFDYEHFFLHSAMGTISRQMRDGRRGSFSSEDSVETTRGPPAATSGVSSEDDDRARASLSHFRSESNASVSTLATFATATEGFGSENGEDEEDDDHDNFAVQDVKAPRPSSDTPPITAKRSTFGSPFKNDIPNDQQHSPPDDTQAHTNGHTRHISDQLVRQESTGTPRSFPLLNKPKSMQLQSPNGLNGLNGTRPRAHGHDSILSDTTTLTDHRMPLSPVVMLVEDDQVLVEQVVASVGRCVLGLQEVDPSSYEARVWRRRLDAARRILDGEEGAI